MPCSNNASFAWFGTRLVSVKCRVIYVYLFIYNLRYYDSIESCPITVFAMICPSYGRYSMFFLLKYKIKSFTDFIVRLYELVKLFIKYWAVNSSNYGIYKNACLPILLLLSTLILKVLRYNSLMEIVFQTWRMYYFIKSITTDGVCLYTYLYIHRYIFLF